MDAEDDAEARRKVWEMIRDIRYAVMVTRHDEGLRSRPMAAQGDEFGDALWFFSHGGSGKVDEIATDPHVLLVYADASRNRYVSISGRAEIVRDRKRIETLWSEPLRAWFPDGPEAEDIALIRVTMETAEYWDSPNGTIAYALGYAKARLTGRPAHPGENKRVEM